MDLILNDPHTDGAMLRDACAEWQPLISLSSNDSSLREEIVRKVQVSLAHKTRLRSDRLENKYTRNDRAVNNAVKW